MSSRSATYLFQSRGLRTDSTESILIVGGEQLNEPVARGGPFVMNTKAEILKAFSDYQEGILTK